MDEGFSIMLGKTKNNIMKKGDANHHNSTGKYYSFGNKGAYKLVANKSVGQYAMKESKNPLIDKRLISQSLEIETLCASHVHESINAMEKVLRNISNLVSPVIDTAFDMQVNYGAVGLKAVATSNSGMWQSSMCVNAKTRILHTEEDCTYTFCKVPSQVSNDTKNIDYQRMFLIQIIYQHPM